MPTEEERQFQDGDFTVEFADQREENLIRRAVLGREAQDFLASQVGRYVVGAAAQDQAEIERKLTKVSPWNRRRILRLQQEHRAVELAIGWITEMVQDGAHAERQLDMEQVTE